MNIYVNFIVGFMIGLEFFSDPLDGNGMILDLGIVRIIFDWSES